MNSFFTYLQKTGYTESSIKTNERAVGKFLSWCSQMSYDVEQMTYEKCTDYFSLLLTRKTKYDKLLKETTIKSYTGCIKLYFKYLVSEDIYTVSPIEKYNYTADKDFEHDTLTIKELELLYICFPTLDIKHPNCKSVAIRNKVVTGFMVFQGLDTKILNHLRVDNINLEKRKLRVPGTKKTEPKTYTLNPEQMSVLKQYLFEDRIVLQNKINNHSEALFPLNSDRFSIITSQVIKVLKTINYKVVNVKQIRTSVIALWVQNDDLRIAQKKSRHRFITSTESYKKYNPNANREAVDEFHLMQ